MLLLMGAANPLYQVGSDAMLADLVPSEKRTNAYAIIRMVNNTGVAVGPAIGGFLASRSYTYAFLCAAVGMITYSLLLVFRARETYDWTYLATSKTESEFLGGYGQVFHDRTYVVFSLLIGLGLITPSLLWTLFAIYTKLNFALPESLYGWLPRTNTLMCVFVQYFVTQISR